MCSSITLHIYIFQNNIITLKLKMQNKSKYTRNEIVLNLAKSLPNQKNLQRDSATRAIAENIATIFNEPTFQSRVIRVILIKRILLKISLILTFKLDTLQNWVSVSMAEAQPSLVGTEAFVTTVTRQFKLWMDNALSVRRQKMRRQSISK